MTMTRRTGGRMKTAIPGCFMRGSAEMGERNTQVRIVADRKSRRAEGRGR